MKDDFDVSKLLTKKSKRINSKAKGGRFERKIAEILNERFKTKDFCRTPGSGAFATTHTLPEHLKIYGDLITPKSFKFIIECKSGYNKEGVSELFNPNSILRKMIDQAARDSFKCSKNFIVVLGQDRKDIIILTDATLPPTQHYLGYDSVFVDLKTSDLCLRVMRLNDLLENFEDNFFLSN
jgi:hypothetical protein